MYAVFFAAKRGIPLFKTGKICYHINILDTEDGKLKKYLEIGKAVSPHGVRGEIKLECWSDSPNAICRVKTVYYNEDAGDGVKVESARPHKSFLLLKLAGIDDMDTANAMRGKVLFADRDEIIKDKNSYFLADLLGLTVVDADSGKSYGVLDDIIKTGANDVYSVKDENGKQRLVPAIKDVVISTNINEGVMKIRPLAGLFDED